MHDNVKVGDYLLLSDRVIGLIEGNKNEAYRVIQSPTLWLLDHRSNYKRIIGDDLGIPFIVGKIYLTLSVHDIVRVVGASCPLAAKAVEFWKNCVTHTVLRINEDEDYVV